METKKDFISFEEHGNKALEALKEVMENMPDQICNKHASPVSFKAYTIENCPECLRLYQEEEMKRNLSDCVQKEKIRLGIGKRYLETSFENYVPLDENQNEVFNSLKEFNNDKNLIITGKFGGGKTFLALSLLDKMIKNNLKCEYVKYYDLSKMSLKDERFSQLINADFIIIDEFGMSETDYKSDVFFQLIDKRWDNEKYVVIVSNVTPTEMKDIMSNATLSRLRVNYLLCALGEKDYRSGL